jgi:hypothetical protein
VKVIGYLLLEETRKQQVLQFLEVSLILSLYLLQYLRSGASTRGVKNFNCSIAYLLP